MFHIVASTGEKFVTNFARGLSSVGVSVRATRELAHKSFPAEAALKFSIHFINRN
jgi:hypothetical protein